MGTADDRRTAAGEVLGATRPCLRPDACPFPASRDVTVRRRWTDVLGAMLPGDLGLVDEILNGLADTPPRAD